MLIVTPPHLSACQSQFAKYQTEAEGRSMVQISEIQKTGCNTWYISQHPSLEVGPKHGMISPEHSLPQHGRGSRSCCTAKALKTSVSPLPVVW